VIELDLMSRAADAASLDGPLAAAAVTLPHGSLHVGGDVVRLRRRRLAPRLLDEPLPLAEERDVAQVPPQAAPVEVRERDQEVCESVVLLPKELGETIREFACVRHARIVSCVFEASQNARIRVRERERVRALENPLAHLRRTRGEICGARSGIPARSLIAEIILR